MDQKSKWIVGAGQNAGILGRVYPVVMDAWLSPEAVYRMRYNRPGPFETILCSNADTAQCIADFFNQSLRETGL